MDGFNFDPSDLGVVGLCVLIVVALARGWLSTGRELNELREDRNEWRRIALRSLTVTERTTDASEVAAKALAALPDVLDGKP